MPARTLPPAALGAVAAACRAAPARCGGSRVVAVEGRSGSGKTALSLRLAVLLAAPGGAPAPVVHLDDLYPGWDGLAATPPLLVEELLEPLAGGRPAGFRRYDWAAGTRAEWRCVHPAPLLLLDGIGSGARACAPYLSLVLWLQAPATLRRARAIGRDGESFAREWERWARQEEDYLAREGLPGRADLVVDTAADGDPPPRRTLLS